MKLDEMEKIRPQSSYGFDIRSFDLGNGKLVTTYEEKDIWRFSCSNGVTEMYAIKDINETLAAVVVADRRVVHDTEYLIVGRIWVAQHLRGKGLATAIYLGLIKKLKEKILSDAEQTPTMISLWDTLSKLATVSVLDVKNGNIVSCDTVTNNQIYNGGDDYRLILEKRISTIPSVGEGILQEYINVTHPDNTNGSYE